MINQQDPAVSKLTVQSSKNKWKLCWRHTPLWQSSSVNPSTQYWVKTNPELHGIKHPCAINTLGWFKNCVGVSVDWQTLGLTRYHLSTTLQLLDRSNIIWRLPANLEKNHKLTQTPSHLLWLIPQKGDYMSQMDLDQICMIQQSDIHQ